MWLEAIIRLDWGGSHVENKLRFDCWVTLMNTNPRQVVANCSIIVLHVSPPHHPVYTVHSHYIPSTLPKYSVSSTHTMYSVKPVSLQTHGWLLIGAGIRGVFVSINGVTLHVVKHIAWSTTGRLICFLMDFIWANWLHWAMEGYVDVWPDFWSVTVWKYANYNLLRQNIPYDNVLVK